MKHAESLNNAELVAKTRENNLVVLATRQVLEIVDAAISLSQPVPDVATAVAHGFAALADNEDFGTNWVYYFYDESGVPQNNMALFLTLEQKVVQPMLAENPGKTREL